MAESGVCKSMTVKEGSRVEVIMIFREILSKCNSDYHSNPGVKMVFLGDSVTHGVFEAYNQDKPNSLIICDFDEVYHTQLRRLLNMVFPSAPVNIINSGISGNSAAQGLERLDRDVLRHCPDLVVVCFGLNDSGAGLSRIGLYTDALRNIFRKLNSNGIEMIFMTPNMKNTYVSLLIQEEFFRQVARETAENQNSGVMDAYMDAARKVCNEEGIRICDCYDKWKKLSTMGVDITMLLSNYINHPTRDMHGLFASSLFETIMFGE